MKNKLASFALLFFLLISLTVGAARANQTTSIKPFAPFGSGYTYQGQLKDSLGIPVDDSCDFLFNTFINETGGSSLVTQEITAVEVDKGYFTVLLSAEQFAYSGEARWLEVAVKCTGDAGYTTLTPRQPFTAVPYSMDSDTLDGTHGYNYAGVNHIHWGQTWSGSGTGLTLKPVSSTSTGIYALATASSGSTCGVKGQSFSPTGIGVSGVVTSTTGTNFGVYGESASVAGTGVYGYSTDLSGITNGVYGSAESIHGRGVFGLANSTTGLNFGVYGLTNSANGMGVYGEANSPTGTTYGVYGYTTSNAGKAVLGHADSTSGYTYGMYGQSDSNNGIGMYGYASNTSGTATGVEGYTEAVSGRGVIGLANNNSGVNSAGIYGRADGNDSFGVAGHAYYDGVGIGAWSYTGNLIEAYAGDYPGGTLRLYLSQAGNLYIDGTYGSFALSSLDGESHATSSLQSTEDWLEDFGRGELLNGKALITIPPDFAGMADLAQEYMVFVTLEGDCQGVFITNKTPTTFEVHEINSGTSSIPFGYRIVARPTDFNGSRLPVIDIPATVAIERSDNTSLPLLPTQSGQTSVQDQQPE